MSSFVRLIFQSLRCVQLSVICGLMTLVWGGRELDWWQDDEKNTISHVFCKSLKWKAHGHWWRYRLNGAGRCTSLWKDLMQHDVDETMRTVDIRNVPFHIDCDVSVPFQVK
jgi:hypothetical protein